MYDTHRRTAILNVFLRRPRTVHFFSFFSSVLIVTIFFVFSSTNHCCSRGFQDSTTFWTKRFFFLATENKLFLLFGEDGYERSTLELIVLHIVGRQT